MASKPCASTWPPLSPQPHRPCAPLVHSGLKSALKGLVSPGRSLRRTASGATLASTYSTPAGSGGSVLSYDTAMSDAAERPFGLALCVEGGACPTSASGTSLGQLPHHLVGSQVGVVQLHTTH